MFLDSSEPRTAATGPAVTEPATELSPTEPAAVSKTVFESASDAISTAAAQFDRVDGVIASVSTRKDAAKSLWTTVLGTFWQTGWAVFGFIAGVPRVVWIVVAVIAAALMLTYLYRQIMLGRIRELGLADRQHELLR